MGESFNYPNNLELEKEYNFPKAELHCHLEGTFRITTIIDLAKKRGIPLPSFDAKTLKTQMCVLHRKKDLGDFLQNFDIITPTFAGCKESLTRLTQEAIEDKANQGVRYIEFRFSPHVLANCNVTPMIYAKTEGDVTPRDVVENICQASSVAQLKFQITVRLILGCMLDFPDWSMEVAHLCKDFSSQGVVGMDVIGFFKPGGPKLEDHKAACEFCKDNGIHITVHADEAGGADEVEAAMNILLAERIGHGYHIVDEEKIYEECKKKKIHFEVCPISSYCTASVPVDLTKHPAIRFMKDDVNFSLSTDNPGSMQTSILQDYFLTKKALNFTKEEIRVLNLNALHSAFCDLSTKEKLINEFKCSYER